MRIIAESNLRDFVRTHPDAEDALAAWAKDTRATNWKTPNEVKAQYGNASILGNSRVCFNIKGNDYRLIVAVLYRVGIVLVKFIGTHKEYNAVTVETVDQFAQEG